MSETRDRETHERTNVVINSNVADGTNTQVEAADNEEADKDGKDNINGEIV